MTKRLGLALCILTVLASSPALAQQPPCPAFVGFVGSRAKRAPGTVSSIEAAHKAVAGLRMRIDVGGRFRTAVYCIEALTDGWIAVSRPDSTGTLRLELIPTARIVKVTDAEE